MNQKQTGNWLQKALKVSRGFNLGNNRAVRVFLTVFFSFSIVVSGTSSALHAAVTTPTTINYQGRLLSATNVPLNGNYTFRFSIWNSADWQAGDTTGGGAVDITSPRYAGWQETHAVTIGATDYGLFNMNLGGTTPFPSFDANIHKHLQVEVKVTGALDTTYEILDPVGTLADATDRKPLQNQAFAQNADTLDNLDSSQVLRSDTSDNFTSGTLTMDNGTTLTVNGVANLGDGGDAIAVNSATWDISGAGVASGLTGLTSTGGIDFSGASAFRTREVAGIVNPGTACATVGELIMDTADQTLYVCSNAGTDTWKKVGTGTDATTVDGIDSTQFLRSDTNDNFTSGTLTMDNGTTLTVNGVANLGDGGDAIAVNSATWDISGAGAASGFTGMESAGTVNFSGSGAFRIREVNNPNANAACATVNELVMDTATSQLMRCTGVGIAGVATWTNVDTTGGSVDFEGLYTNDADKVLTTSNGNFTVNTGTGDFIVTTGIGGDLVVNGVNFNDMPFGNLATRAKKQSFKVEYDGSTLNADGTNNKGQMTVDNETGTKRNYYEWTTRQAGLQDMDVVISFKLPLDFVSFTGAPMSVDYKTNDGTIGNNRVDIGMSDTAGAAVVLTGGSALANSAWTTANITFGGGETFAAGGTVTIRLKLSALSGSFARISDIVLNYNGR